MTSTRVRALGAAGLTLGLVVTSSAQFFDAPLPLKVFVRPLSDEPGRLVGFTPSHKQQGLKIPSSTWWYVRPVGPMGMERLTELSELIQKQSIPGLDLSERWDIGDSHLAILDQLQSLQLLFIQRTRIGDQGMEHLKALKNLRWVAVGTRVTDKGVKHLGALSKLTTLDLTGTRVTDTGLAAVAAITTLENLNLAGTRVSDAGLGKLKSLAHLKALTLNGRITDSGAAHLRDLVTLEHLDLSATTITERGLAALKGLHHLKRLYLNPMTTDIGLESVATLTQLEKLDLSNAAVTDEGVARLQTLGQLRELSLSGTPVTEQCLGTLAGLSRLELLDLSYTTITAAGLDKLSKLSHLHTVSLPWNELTTPEMQSLAALPHLQVVILNGSPLPGYTLAQIKALAKLAKRNPVPTQKGVASANLTHSAVPPRKPAVPAHGPAALKNVKAPPLIGLKQVHQLGSEGLTTMDDVIEAKPPPPSAYITTEGEGESVGEFEVRSAPAHHKN